MFYQFDVSSASSLGFSRQAFKIRHYLWTSHYMLRTHVRKYKVNVCTLISGTWWKNICTADEYRCYLNLEHKRLHREWPARISSHPRLIDKWPWFNYRLWIGNYITSGEGWVEQARHWPLNRLIRWPVSSRRMEINEGHDPYWARVMEEISRFFQPSIPTISQFIRCRRWYLMNSSTHSSNLVISA